MIDATTQTIPIPCPRHRPLSPPNKRIGPRHPRLGAAGFRAARWLSARLFAAAGFHQLGSEFADQRIAHVREKLQRGETVYLAGLGPPGTHNSGVALVEVTQANGPRLIVNNEEERFSGNKHTTEYPRHSIDAMVATLRGIGRDIGDIDAWLTSWDYPTLAGTIARSVLEEVPQSLKLLRTTEAAGFDGRRLDQMTRTPKILGRQLGLAERVPLICLPHHDNHAWFSFAASPFADDGEPVAIAVLDGTGDKGSISLYVAEHGAMRQLFCNDSMFNSLGAFYSVISSTQGGWTWLSSEGRYMGAAAWGDMNRASNPYYARLRDVLDFGADGDIRINRALANWYCDPFDHPYKAALIDILGEPLKPDQLWNPDAVLRVEDITHRPDTQDRLDKAAATQLVFEDAMIHVVDHLLRITGASRLVLTGGVALNAVGNMRLLEHFDEAWFEKQPAAQGPPASVGAADTRRSRRHHRRRLAVRASGRRAARCRDDACVLLRFAADARRHRNRAAGRRYRLATDRRHLDARGARRRGRSDGLHGGAERHHRAVSGRRRNRAARARPSLDLCQSLRRASARTAQRTGQIPRGDPPAGADGDAGGGTRSISICTRAPPTPITTPTITWC